jgi:hypothetical protein
MGRGRRLFNDELVIRPFKAGPALLSNRVNGSPIQPIDVRKITSALAAVWNISVPVRFDAFANDQVAIRSPVIRSATESLIPDLSEFRNCQCPIAH